MRYRGINHLQKAMLGLNFCVEDFVWNINQLYELTNLVWLILLSNLLSRDYTFDFQLHIFIADFLGKWFKRHYKNILVQEFLRLFHKVTERVQDCWRLIFLWREIIVWSFTGTSFIFEELEYLKIEHAGFVVIIHLANEILEKVVGVVNYIVLGN